MNRITGFFEQSGFWEVVRREVKINLQYKAAFAISAIIQPVIILINIAMFTSLYAYNGTALIKGYTLSQMIWYFNSVSLIWIVVFNFTDFRLSDRILSGDLMIDLLRPIGLLRFELAVSAGLRLTASVVELLPCIAVNSLLYLPDFMTPSSVLRCLVTVLLAFFLVYLINFLVGLSAFALKSNSAMSSIKNILLALLGGSSIPIDFYPGAVRAVLQFLPFQYIFYWPTRFLLNMEDTKSLFAFLRVCSIDLFWIAALYAACRFCYARSIRRFCAVG